MRRITCRNGFVFVAAIGLGLMATSARGGSLDAPAGPTSSASAMWTLKDIYDVLDTRTTNVTKRTAFREPTGGPTGGTMHNLNDIMTLVTNRAPVPKTGQTNTYWVGDDGTNRIGVAWPSPRFTVQSTNTPGQPDDRTNCVLDNLTGLMWARNANIASNAHFNAAWSTVNGTCTWYQAFDVITNSAGPVNGANYGGYSDWRMPNRRELESVRDEGRYSPALCNTAGTGPWAENDPFTGVQTLDAYNSSSSRLDMDYAFYVSMKNAGTSSAQRTAMHYVWPVRGGQ